MFNIMAVVGLSVLFVMITAAWACYDGYFSKAFIVYLVIAFAGLSLFFFSLYLSHDMDKETVSKISYEEQTCDINFKKLLAGSENGKEFKEMMLSLYDEKESIDKITISSSNLQDETDDIVLSLKIYYNDETTETKYISFSTFQSYEDYFVFEGTTEESSTSQIVY